MLTQCSARIPQIIKNFREKSCKGLPSIRKDFKIFADFFGRTLNPFLCTISFWEFVVCEIPL